IPFTLVRQLGNLSDHISWHILQRGNSLKEWHGKFGRNTGSDDILAAARVIAALDLLICVDSMPAHLAGALSVPTWLLLHNRADWRWMVDRDDSPWYPTLRLFRQPRPGDWQSVLAAVTHLLSDWDAVSMRSQRCTYD